MDHLFHKNLLAEKHNLEWQLAQANLKIKNLQEQLNKLTKQTMISEEIGVNPGTANPAVPPPHQFPSPFPNPFPHKPPFTRPLPDNTRPVPMPKPRPPRPTPAMPSLDGILRKFRLIKETSGNPSGNPALANVESNITHYILENRNFIFEGMFEANPNLFENYELNSESAANILHIVLEDIMNDEQFIRGNYKILSAPVLTDEARKILSERVIPGIIKKGIKILFDLFGTGKKIPGKVIPDPPTPPNNIPIKPGRPLTGNPMDGYRDPRPADGLPFGKPEKPDGWMGPGWWKEFGDGDGPPPPSPV